MGIEKEPVVFKPTMDPNALDVMRGDERLGSLQHIPNLAPRFVPFDGEMPLPSLDIGLLEKIVDESRKIQRRSGV